METGEPHAGSANAKFAALFGCIGLVVLLSGCSTTLAKMDHMQMRSRMIEYTEDQIMDNLVRAHMRLPLVHFDLNKMDAIVKTGLSGTVSGGQTLTRTGQGVSTNSNGAIVSVVGTAINAAQRPFTFSASPSRDNTITVGVTPVLNANEVYEAYEYFANLPGSIICSPRPKVAPGAEDPHHFGRTWEDGKYYWVPTRYREEFFKLSLRVAVKRGEVDGAPTPLDTKPGPPSVTKKLRITPLDAPSVTLPERPKSPAERALEDAADGLRRLRLFQQQ